MKHGVYFRTKTFFFIFYFLSSPQNSWTIGRFLKSEDIFWLKIFFWSLPFSFDPYSRIHINKVLVPPKTHLCSPPVTLFWRRAWHSVVNCSPPLRHFLRKKLYCPDAMTWRWAPPTRYTRRRITASIMKDFIWLSLLKNKLTRSKFEPPVTSSQK